MGKRVRSTPCGFRLFPGELGGGLVADVKPVFRGEAADDLQLWPPRQEKHGFAAQRGRDMADRSPDHVIGGCGGGDAAAEVVKLVGPVRDGGLGLDARTQAGGQIAGDQRGDEEKA